MLLLQGWLKALNHPDLSLSKDAGQDGVSSGAAADAFGMVLGYYKGDYRRQGSWLNGNVNPAPELAEPDAGNQLFNGNIASWSSKSLGVATQAAPTLTAEHFRYDQLNRLVQSEQRAPSSGSWTATNQYGTSYSYDPNGNLTSLTRQQGQSGQYMDQLSYSYLPDNQGNPTNKLEKVADTVPDGVSDEDVDNQLAGNYDYDEVGNLIRDDQGGVAKISWTPYGKIGRIEKKDGTVITYRYDAMGNRIGKLFKSATTSLNTYYMRDASGNMLAVYEAEPGKTLRLVEQPLYGSARVGERKPILSMPDPNASVLPLNLPDGVVVSRELGLKYYEVSDHLGNVRAVLTDQKTSVINPGTGQPVLSSLMPVLSNYYNYYAFGQLQPGRYGSGNPTAAGGYRFGYNGKEKDNNGELGLTTYDYGFRIYNPGIGKFLSLDPVASHFPWNSPYTYAENRIIDGIDFDGLEVVLVNEKKDAIIYNYGMKNDDDEHINVYAHGNPTVMEYTNQKTNRIATITNSKTFDLVMSRRSEQWRNRQKTGGTVVTLHSCRTGKTTGKGGKPLVPIAQQLSKDFKNVVFIAPDERDVFQPGFFGVSEIGPFEADSQYEDGERTPKSRDHAVNLDKPGHWLVFKNGKQIASYDGDWDTHDYDYSESGSDLPQPAKAAKVVSGKGARTQAKK